MTSKTHKGLVGGIIFLVLIAGGYLIYSKFTTPVKTTPSIVSPVISPTFTPILDPVSPVMADLVSPVSPLPSALKAPSLSEEVFEIIKQAEDAYAQGNNEEALTVINEAVTVEPFNPFAFNTRGNIYVALKQYDNALLDYSKAIELDPGFPGPYYNKGRLLYTLKRPDEAIANLQKSAELAADEFGYRANGNIGLIYHQQGEYDKALEAYAAAISFDDTKADTYFHRGETYTAMGNYEAAVSDYEAAISRFSKYDQAYQSLGYARYKIGQFDQALEALDKALELSPNSPTPHFYRMLVYLATQQTDKPQAEVSQGMDHIGTLPEEEQSLLFKRVLDDLESFAQANSTQAQEVEALINLIPQP